MFRLTDFACFLIVNIVIDVKCDIKSSLTFVIDDTASMSDDIEAVKESANDIFDVVTKSNASQIDDFVLTTFNDPDYRHRVTTTDRYDFKRALAAIDVNGGGDCPEMAMTGIEEALRHSKQESLLYVFTDASAKDASKYDTVRRLALKKQAQVTFVLTGDCGYEGNDKVFYNLAKNTDAQVFHLEKHEVPKILKYVEHQIKSRREVIANHYFPPGTHKFNYSVDSKMKELVISVSGTDPTVKVTDPDGKDAVTEDIVRSMEIAIVKIVEVKPGVYSAEVSSPSETSVKVTAETTVHFQYGFSPYQATSIKDTATAPLPGEHSYLSIKLTTEGDGNVELDTAQILNLYNKVVNEKPLKLINKHDQFYVTDSLYPPGYTFRIAVKGHDNVNNKEIFRISLTPIEPQVIEGKASNKAPDVSLIGDEKVEVEYGKSLEIKCKVNAFPKPNVIWEDKDGAITESNLSQVEIPYDFISIMRIDKVINDNTFKCLATNELGRASKNVEVSMKTYFKILKRPTDVTIEIGTRSVFECKIDAKPPPYIKWYKHGKVIKENEDIEISGESLTILNMKPKYAGQYACLARNEIITEMLNFTVSISGAEPPKIEKSISEIFTTEGSSVDIPCKLFEGKPKPKIRWFFNHVGERRFNNFTEKNDVEVIHLKNMNDEYFGSFRCIAYNEVGYDMHTILVLLEYPPFIHDNSANIIAKQGERVKIPCNADGQPNPDVKWLLNDTELMMISKYHRSYTSGDLFFLADKNDSGLYTCQASNRHGIATKSFNLTIFKPATIKSPAESIYFMKVGDRLSLSCDADGYPRPNISWEVHDLETKKSKEIKETGPLLHFRRIQPSQQGYYTCIASNIGSSSNITYEIRVYAPPMIENVYPEKTFYAVVGDLVVRVPCKASGNPKPDISWIRDGVDRVATGTEWYDQEEDGTLVIKNVDKYSAGTYVCQAENVLGFDNETYEVVVEAYPRPGSPTKTVLVGLGNSTTLKCDVPHQRTDSVRWYKDGRLISSMQEHHLMNAKLSDAGIYTCRISNFAKSRSGNVRVKVGYAPRFLYEEETNIDFEQAIDAVMDCSAEGDPTPEVSWWHNAEKLPTGDMTYVFQMRDLKQKGLYFCLVKNDFGQIFRKYIISSRECIIDIESDLKANSPLILDSDSTWPLYETVKGHWIIPPGESLRLLCPSEFNKTHKRELIATCEREKTFNVERKSQEFSSLKCVNDFEPTIKMTGEACLPTSTHAESIKVGYEVNGEFKDIYSVCIDTSKRTTLYAKNQMRHYFSGVEPKETIHHYKTEIVPFNLDELYNCGLQINTTSSILGRWFHKEDRCCFRERQLVSPKDVLPGLPQKATYHVLNIVPHWSSCNTKNWDHIERRVRNLAESTNVRLEVWTGVSQQQLQMVEKPISLYDRDSREQPVARYLWKVVQDSSTKASLAIIQLNIPDLNLTEAYRNMLCKDICNEVTWMKGKYWRKVDRGYTFCCNIRDFERAFGYIGVFGGSGKVLYDVSLVPDHSLALK